MQLFDSNALIQCIQDAVRKEVKSVLSEEKTFSQATPPEEKLLTKKEMAEELDISLVTLTDWMKKGLPYLQLHKRIYFRKAEVLKSMAKNTK